MFRWSRVGKWCFVIAGRSYLTTVKRFVIFLISATFPHVGFSQELGLVSRDSLKSVLLEIKDLVKSGEMDEALAKIDFYRLDDDLRHQNKEGT